MSRSPRIFWPFSRGQSATILMLAVLIGLFLLYKSWDASADRMIQAEIDAAHARGEIILPEDYPQPAAVPDEQNAAKFWLDAAKHALLTNDQAARESDLEGLGQYPPTPAELAFLREITDGRTEFRLDVVEAQARASVNWNVDPRAGLLMQDVPEMTQVRAVAQMLLNSSLVAHVDGRDDVVIDNAISILRLSRDAQSLPPSLITHLVSIGISATAASSIERLGPDLQLARDFRTRALIDGLLDETALDHGFQIAMQTQRAQSLNFMQMLTAKPIVGTTQKVALARSLKWQREVEQAGCEPTYPAARKLLASRPPPSANVYKYVPAIANILHGSLERALETQYRIRCDRRLAALLLAIRSYQCEHQGALPARLDELVPKYISGVPIDPFASDGRTLGYHRDGDRPFIYSVGVDGVDDGGSTALIRAGRTRIAGRERNRWEEKDSVMYLVLIPRELPATQPADH